MRNKEQVQSFEEMNSDECSTLKTSHLQKFQLENIDTLKETFSLSARRKTSKIKLEMKQSSLKFNDEIIFQKDCS